jgi:hypothetical protein
MKQAQPEVFFIANKHSAPQHSQMRNYDEFPPRNSNINSPGGENKAKHTSLLRCSTSSSCALKFPSYRVRCSPCLPVEGSNFVEGEKSFLLFWQNNFPAALHVVLRALHRPKNSCVSNEDDSSRRARSLAIRHQESSPERACARTMIERVAALINELPPHTM